MRMCVESGLSGHRSLAMDGGGGCGRDRECERERVSPWTEVSRGRKRPESLATATTKAYGIASPWDEQLDVHSAIGGKKLKGKPLGEAV